MIFLGQASNYSAGRIFKHLFARGRKEDAEALKKALAKKYKVKDSEKVILYHTGRSALAAAFISVVPKKSYVIIPGLTCIAVVRAVRAADCIPVFVDIDPETLQYDWQKLVTKLEELQPKGDRSSQEKLPIDKKHNLCYNRIIILAQNTLGIPLDALKLEKIAQKYHATLVEDLAHSAGRFYPDGREIGTIGAATALSFGKGKAVDTIEGGALIVRTESVTIPRPPSRLPKPSDRWRDRWYPLLGAIIRVGYRIKLGKVFTGIFLKFHWIARSADADLDLGVGLPNWQARLAREQLTGLPKTPLRDHMFVKQRSKLLSELGESGYYLNEIWYDVPVSPARCSREVDFPTNECPNTVQIAKTIINFPTWYNQERLAPAREIARKYEVKNEVE